MRRIVAFNHVSADGYFASAEGSLDWVLPDDALDEAGVERTAHTDTMLFGRRTYEMFKSFVRSWIGSRRRPSGLATS